MKVSNNKSWGFLCFNVEVTKLLQARNLNVFVSGVQFLEYFFNIFYF